MLIIVYVEHLNFIAMKKLKPTQNKISNDFLKTYFAAIGLAPHKNVSK